MLRTGEPHESRGTAACVVRTGKSNIIVGGLTATSNGRTLYGVYLSVLNRTWKTTLRGYTVLSATSGVCQRCGHHYLLKLYVSRSCIIAALQHCSAPNTVLDSMFGNALGPRCPGNQAQSNGNNFRARHYWWLVSVPIICNMHCADPSYRATFSLSETRREFHSFLQLQSRRTPAAFISSAACIQMEIHHSTVRTHK